MEKGFFSKYAKSNAGSIRRKVLSVGLLAAASGARAQGLISAGSNVERLVQVGITIIIAVGVLAGLGFILKGLWDLTSKTARGNDDITWGSISSKIGGGGLAMALGWLGVQVVETLGGSAGDIGRGI